MNSIMKRILLAFTCLIGASVTTWAQQQVMFTQYMFNTLAINPAYAGSAETFSATALMREQWTGLDGAPSTQTLSLHAPVKNQRMGLGLLFLHDKIGVTNQTGGYISYAYRIPFANGGKLAMGIQGGFTNYNAKYSQVSTTDPTFSADVRETQPNFGAGFFYYTERFYAGISVPQLIQNNFGNSIVPNSESKIVRHYFGMIGYVMDLNESLKLKPNVLVKYVYGAPLELDLNANLLIKEIIWVGLSWRSFDSMDALLQIQLGPRLQIGYAYDFSTQREIRAVNSGSHEFMINYRIPNRRDRIVTPRYF